MENNRFELNKNLAHKVSLYGGSSLIAFDRSAVVLRRHSEMLFI